MRPGSIPPPFPSDLIRTVEAADDPGVVVALGAWCDMVTEDEARDELVAMGITGESFEEEMGHVRRRASFDVAEFALLGDGRCLTLHAGELGFSSGALRIGAQEASVAVDSSGAWRYLTADGVEASVRTTVLPVHDADGDDEHPWEWLTQLLGAHGVRTTVDHLRSVPYVVELSDRLTERLAADH